MRIFTLICLFVFSCLNLQAQQKTLQLEDYPKWSRVISPEVSPTGDWFAYSLRPNGSDDTLHIMSVADRSIIRVPNGSRPAFSKKGNYVGYFTRPLEEEAEKLKRPKNRSSKKPMCVSFPETQSTQLPMQLQWHFQMMASFGQF